MTQNDYLVMWTVYWNPDDYPDKYVARRFHNDKPQGEHYTSESVEVIRARLRGKGLIPIPRSPEDEPHILECWI